ncbi:MAG: hypothetical protein ABIE70_09990 [bacterium]
MKRLVWISTAIVLVYGAVAVARPSAGSSFGCLTTARTLTTGVGQAGLGVGLGIGNRHRNSVSGSLGYGLFDYIDGTIKLGFSDADKVRAAVGVELKYQFLNAGPALDDPFDLAVGAFGEYLDDIFQLGVCLTGSKTFALGSVRLLTPYARFNTRIENDSGKSEIEVGLHGGVEWGITENISVFGELQIDGRDGIFLGLKDLVF